MEIKSLGYRTDLIFPKFDGIIVDRNNYLVIMTPTNPRYHWGNFLLFHSPPAEGDVDNWKDTFRREIGSKLTVSHFAFGWDTTIGELGEAEAFLQIGFNLNKSLVLSAQQVRMPPKYNKEVAIRPLTKDWEWEQATESQIECRRSEYSLEGYRPFKTNQMKQYRKMTENGLGQWFGAFLGEELVADLGIFTTGDTARFQNVETRPKHQRQGICGALVYQVSCYAIEKMRQKKLVMVADENYHAAKIYESIGFVPNEYQVGIDWWEKNEE